MNAGARVRHQEKQRAATLGVCFQRHGVATQTDIFAVHAGHCLAGVHHRGQALALLQTTLVGKRTIGLGRVMVNFGHLLKGYLIRLGHQFKPVGFGQLCRMCQA